YCKSPMTSPIESKYPHASTISFSSCGGFFGPEIKFAGYDGLIFTGRADSPVYVVIEDDRVEIRDAGKYWGMMTYPCEKQLMEDLGDRRFEICTIGPSAENGVRYSGVLHSHGHAAGRGGTGCVMGSKNLKAVAVKGTRMPQAADHQLLLSQIKTLWESMRNTEISRYGSGSLVGASDRGTQAVRNYREGTFLDVDKIGGMTAEQHTWIRDISCYCCPTACKKIAVSRGGKWGKFVAEGPEYETGTMLGTNLMINDHHGMQMLIGLADDYGYDQISIGNVIGFLMECYEKGLIDRKFLDGIDLTWGNVQASSDVMRNIANRKGNLGEVAIYGVKHLSEVVGQGSEAFAIHSKGHEYAAHNLHANAIGRTIGYVTNSRGACHRGGRDAAGQNSSIMDNVVAICNRGAGSFLRGELTTNDLLQSVTGNTWNSDVFAMVGERIINLEKCFNYREGFRRADDEWVPERFFTESLTVGPRAGAIVDRKEFIDSLNTYYTEREWDQKTSKPSREKLVSLGLEYAWEEIANI
ncbi:aldehyde ferredoxin oxidoreductase family protein, partial [Candidatus Latescibacterota bacterium]